MKVTRIIKQRIVEELNNNKLNAILLPFEFAEYYSKTSCQITLLEEYLMPFGYIVGIHSPSNSTFITSLNKGILQSQEDIRNQVEFRRMFDVYQVVDCNSQTRNTISLERLGGIWIIMASLIFFCLFVYLVKHLKMFSYSNGYMCPYYNYYSDKTELYENQLKDALKYEVSKILGLFEEEFFAEIEQYEKLITMREEGESLNYDSKKASLHNIEPESKFEMEKEVEERKSTDKLHISLPYNDDISEKSNLSLKSEKKEEN